MIAVMGKLLHRRWDGSMMIGTLSCPDTGCFLNLIQVQKWSCALEKTTDFELDLVYKAEVLI
jgi:hypothetical protein